MYATVLPAKEATFVLLEDRGQVLRVDHRDYGQKELIALKDRACESLGALKPLLRDVEALVPVEHDERARVHDLARQSEMSEDKGSTRMHLFLTHSCNFRCSYCIQGHEIKKKNSSVMSVGTVDDAFSTLPFIVDAIPHGIMPKAVTLFGGEPIMPGTRAPFMHAIDRAVETGLRVDVVTNGYYYDDFAPRLTEKGILSKMSFLVSIDGPAEIHNVRRSLVNGRGTFQKVAENVDRMLDHGARVILQPIVDEANVDRLEELYELAERRGWLAEGTRFEMKCGITMYPNAEAFEGRSGSSEGAVLGKLLRFSSAHSRVSAGFDAVLKRSHFLDMVAREGKKVAVTTACDAKRAGTLSFSPDGFFYPCREYAGHGEEKALGRFSPGLKVFAERFSSWFGWKVSSHPKCAPCKHVLVCGGGCRVETETHGRDERVDPLCPDFEGIWRTYLDQVDV